MKDHISIIRRMLQLSQFHMGDFLEVSKSHIAMAETGKRKLPAAAQEILDQLWTALGQKADENLISAYIQREEKGFAKWKKEVTILSKAELVTRKTKLAKMKAEYEERLKAIPEFSKITITRDDAQGEIQRNTLNLSNAVNLKKLAECGKIRQRELEIEIAMLEVRIRMMTEEKEPLE